MFPLAFESMDPINRAGREFILELGHQISGSADDPRETQLKPVSCIRGYRLQFNDLTPYEAPTLLSTSLTLMKKNSEKKLNRHFF
jgi:hypothetical protein